MEKDNRLAKFLKILDLFNEHIRPAGDPWGVTDRANQYIEKYLNPILTKESRVLDVGAGDCLNCNLLKDKIAYWEGINKGPDVVTSQEQGYNVKDMDFHFLEYPDNSFDLLIAVSTLEHAACPPLMLSEMHRVTKKHVFVQMPVPVEISKLTSYEDNPDHHFIISTKLWEKMFRIIGFGIVSQGIHGGEYQYLLTK